MMMRKKKKKKKKKQKSRRRRRRRGRKGRGYGLCQEITLEIKSTLTQERGVRQSSNKIHVIFLTESPWWGTTDAEIAPLPSVRTQSYKRFVLLKPSAPSLISLNDICGLKTPCFVSLENRIQPCMPYLLPGVFGCLISAFPIHSSSFLLSRINE